MKGTQETSEFESEIEAVNNAVEDALENPVEKCLTVRNAVSELETAMREAGYETKQFGKGLNLIKNGYGDPSQDADPEIITDGILSIRAAMNKNPEKKEQTQKTDTLTADAIGRARKDMATRPHRTPGVEPY